MSEYPSVCTGLVPVLAMTMPAADAPYRRFWRPSGVYLPYPDSELRAWATKAAQSRKKCAVDFSEEELYAVLKESVGR